MLVLPLEQVVHCVIILSRRWCGFVNAQTVGSKINKMRLAHNMTQKELADKLSVTDKAVSKWETGGGMPELTSLRAIASVFGVTVDYILSENSLPPQKAHYLARFKIWVRTREAKLTGLILLCVLGMFYFSYNIYWNRYISETFDPFIKSETIQSVPQWNQRVIRSRGWVIRTYDDHGRSDYHFSIQIPPRLNFGGNVNIQPLSNQSQSDHSLSLTIFMNSRGDWRYVLGIVDFNAKEYDEYSGEFNTVRIGSAVDKYGQPVGRHLDDTPERYQMWLTMHDKFNDSIMEMFDDIKEIFGEGAFR
jgi:transcriptional regulator with XRE-family HTH domain